MFKRKKDWLYLELNAEEKRLLRRAMLDFRNKVLAQNGPTEDIDRIILMLARYDIIQPQTSCSYG